MHHTDLVNKDSEKHLFSEIYPKMGKPKPINNTVLKMICYGIYIFINKEEYFLQWVWQENETSGCSDR